MKKLFALMLALVMLTGTALAAGSKGTSDMTGSQTVVEPAEETAVVVEPVAVDMAEVLDAVNEFTAEKAVVELFSESEKAAIAEQLPADVEPEQLVLQESFAIAEYGYEDGVGDVTIEFTTPTDFSSAKAVVAMVGIPKAGAEMTFEGMYGENKGYDWYVCPAEVVGGKVQVTFSADVLKLIGAGSVLNILSAE